MLRYYVSGYMKRVHLFYQFVCLTVWSMLYTVSGPVKRVHKRIQLSFIIIKLYILFKKKHIMTRTYTSNTFMMLVKGLHMIDDFYLCNNRALLFVIFI